MANTKTVLAPKPNGKPVAATKPAAKPAAKPAPQMSAEQQAEIAKAAQRAVLKEAFRELPSAAPSFSSNYPTPGTYWLRINSVDYNANRKDEKRLIIESHVVRTLEDAGSAKQPGEQCGIIMSRKFESFMPNVKSFLMGALGCADGDVTDDTIAQVIVDEILNGHAVEVRCYEIITSGGSPFNKYEWRRPVPASEIAAYFAEQGEAGEATKEKLYPGDLLDRLVAAEASVAE